MDKIEKEFTYKGQTKKFSVAIEQLPPFNPETMDKDKYEETQKVLFLMAEEEIYNQKTEWIFSIEKKLQQ
ncbi:hypothetical protein IM532_11815 [Faecalibacter sp. WQ 117]|uniref:Uncharacterized protein n=2 Tax=Faecalibacter rhinopitheci TaxID=2779678 RepID=A0A8J7FP71_9FLAO|nr:hypothetical protein [Faecalibacter rhinopitheci]